MLHLHQGGLRPKEGFQFPFQLGDDLGGFLLLPGEGRRIRPPLGQLFFPFFLLPFQLLHLAVHRQLGGEAGDLFLQFPAQGFPLLLPPQRLLQGGEFLFLLG